MNHPRILPTLTPSHHLHLILGCMYSGKTTELIRLLGTYEMAHINCLLIKLDKDVRYGEGTKEVQTHDGLVCYYHNVLVFFVYLYDNDNLI